MKKLIFCLALACLAGPACSQIKSSPLYVVLDKSEKGVALTVDGSFRKEDNYYEIFAEYFRKPGGKGRPVFIIFNRNLPYSEADDAVAELQAIGFDTTRMFVFSKETQKMVEIEVKGEAVEIPVKISGPS